MSHAFLATTGLSQDGLESQQLGTGFGQDHPQRNEQNQATGGVFKPLGLLQAINILRRKEVREHTCIDFGCKKAPKDASQPVPPHS